MTRTVADRVAEIRSNFGIFIGAGRIGDMPHDKGINSFEPYAREK